MRGLESNIQVLELGWSLCLLKTIWDSERNFFFYLYVDKQGLELKLRLSTIDFSKAFCQINGFHEINNLSSCVFLKCDEARH